MIRPTSNMNAESSIELIQRAQAGDSLALELLLERYRPRLHRWATGRLPRHAREQADTEDLVQDVLMGTVRNLGGFELRGEWALQAYLRGALMNRVRNELERAQRHPRVAKLDDQLPSDELSPLQKAVGSETFGRYEAALATLGEREREAVIARVELGCSYQEIAALLDSPSPDAARMLVGRAIRKTAEAMALQSNGGVAVAPG